MNTYNDYTEKSRTLKNKSKTREHQRRQLNERDICRFSNVSNKKTLQAVKNYKRNNTVEKNPLIVNLRGKFDSVDDYNAWCEHLVE